MVDLDLLPANPAARVKRAREPKRTRHVLSKAECGTLVKSCDPHMRVLVLAGFLTGARPSELLAVTWGDVSFGNRTISIFRHKVGVGDALPLHPQLAEELRALNERRGRVADDDYVFLSSKGRAHFDYRWGWRKALKIAGLDRRAGLTFYSTRHSFATHYLEKGAPSDLQALMGHASYSTTERYVRSVSDRARVGVEALDLGA